VRQAARKARRHLRSSRRREYANVGVPEPGRRVAVGPGGGCGVAGRKYPVYCRLMSTAFGGHGTCPHTLSSLETVVTSLGPAVLLRVVFLHGCPGWRSACLSSPIDIPYFSMIASFPVRGPGSQEASHYSSTHDASGGGDDGGVGSGWRRGSWGEKAGCKRNARMTENAGRAKRKTKGKYKTIISRFVFLDFPLEKPFPNVLKSSCTTGKQPDGATVTPSSTRPSTAAGCEA